LPDFRPGSLRAEPHLVRRRGLRLGPNRFGRGVEASPQIPSEGSRADCANEGSDWRGFGEPSFRIMKRHSFCWHMALSSKLPPAHGPRKCPSSREACRMSSTPGAPRRPILAPQGRVLTSLLDHRAEASSASSFHSRSEPAHDGVGRGIRSPGSVLSDFFAALSTSG